MTVLVAVELTGPVTWRGATSRLDCARPTDWLVAVGVSCSQRRGETARAGERGRVTLTGALEHWWGHLYGTSAITIITIVTTPTIL